MFTLSRTNAIASRLIVDAVGESGGGTVDKDGNPASTSSGYVVGGKVPTMVGCTIADLRDWIDANPSDYYGSWLDSETGKIHYDAVDFVTDRDEAIRLGLERGEIAIWDAAAGEEIRLVDYLPDEGESRLSGDYYDSDYWGGSDDSGYGDDPDGFSGHYDESGY
jgi:hypothetical protein